jgi:uncharacterized protein YidB (DUF937 family)
MSLFDQLKGQLDGILAAETAGAEGAKSPAHDPHVMLDSVVALITQHGGLSGLLEKLKASGLGDVVASWVGTGDNRPVAPDQLAAAVGTDTISQIAAKLGTTKEHAISLLSKYLPLVINQLTPNGKVEEGGLLEKGLNFIKSHMPGAAKPSA